MSPLTPAFWSRKEAVGLEGALERGGPRELHREVQPRGEGVAENDQRGAEDLGAAGARSAAPP